MSNCCNTFTGNMCVGSMDFMDMNGCIDCNGCAWVNTGQCSCDAPPAKFPPRKDLCANRDPGISTS